MKNVVLLFPKSPGRDLEMLLMHPSYVNHVTYVQGTPLREKDLSPVSLATGAEGVQVVLVRSVPTRP